MSDDRAVGSCPYCDAPVYYDRDSIRRRVTVRHAEGEALLMIDYRDIAAIGPRGIASRCYAWFRDVHEYEARR